MVTPLTQQYTVYFWAGSRESWGKQKVEEDRERQRKTEWLPRRACLYSDHPIDFWQQRGQSEWIFHSWISTKQANTSWMKTWWTRRSDCVLPRSLAAGSIWIGSFSLLILTGLHSEVNNTSWVSVNYWNKQWPPALTSFCLFGMGFSLVQLKLVSHQAQLCSSLICLMIAHIHL